MVSSHQTAEARSLRYHAAIAQRIEQDASIVPRASARAERWLQDGSVASHYALGWQELLTGSIQELLAFLVSPSEASRAFRQVSPFAGVLSPRERWALWAQEQDDDATAA